MDNTGDMTGQERAALALWLLMQGPMDLCSLAKKLGLTKSGCRTMLIRVSRVVPICHGDDGVWFVMRS